MATIRCGGRCASRAYPVGWKTALCAIGLFIPCTGLTQESCRARLHFQNSANSESCPTEREVRSAVAGRLGYDPFCEEAELQVRVAVKRRGHSFAGEIALQDRGGALRGERRIAGDYSRCEQLAAALTLAISIAIDPLGEARGTRAPPPPRDPESRPAEPAPPPQPVERPFSFDLGAGAGVVFGSLPEAGASVLVAVRASWSRYSLGLEGQWDLPVTSPVSSGKMKASRMGMSLVPCLRGKWTSGCVVVSAGVLQVEGQDLAIPRRASAVTLAAGLRGELELPVSAAVALRLQATISIPFVYAHVAVSDSDVWKTPPIAGMLGAVLTLRL